MGTKIEEIRGKFVTSFWGSSMGGFGAGFGWIWGGFWEGFGGLWEARGARMETKMEEIRGHFVILSSSWSDCEDSWGILEQPSES